MKLLRIFVVFLVLIVSILSSCDSSSNHSITGKWYNTEFKNETLEFFDDLRVVYDDGSNIVIGAYELRGDYIALAFADDIGNLNPIAGAELRNYQLIEDSLTISKSGFSVTLRRFN